MQPTHKSWISILQLILLLNFQVTAILQEFFIIKNTSFSCEEGSWQMEQFRQIDLTDEDKMELLESEGGYFVPSYMALDHRSAEENFVNLLPLPSFDLKDERDKTIQDKNQRENSYSKRVDRKTFEKKAAVLKYLKEIVEKEKRILAENVVEVSHGSRSSEAVKKPNRRLISRRGRNKRRTKISAPEIISSSVQQRNANSTVHRDLPYVLPQELGIKSSHYSESGERTVSEYCEERGTASQNGYLYLCTTCARTEELSKDHFPSVVNEATCMENDSFCFIVEGVAEGNCKQNHIPMHILRRKPGHCALALKNDEVVIVDEWILGSYQRRVGCNCMLHEDSILAQYV